MRRLSIYAVFTHMICFILFINVCGVIAQGHGDPFPVAAFQGRQEIPQVAFNNQTREYLAVWEDQRNGTDADIYGQFFNSDGSLKGENFEICTASGHQYWPHLAFDPELERFLIVFEDWRDPQNPAIGGIFVNADGTFYDAPTSEADHTFKIRTDSTNVYTCSVAFNLEFTNYLVVWGDSRNEPNSWTGADVYGQLVDADGTLLAPPAPADPVENFPIAYNTEYEESVTDVTWIAGTQEYFVVFGTSIGYVLGQRVDGVGNLVNSEGAASAKADSWGSAIQCSEHFMNGTDCLQAKVKGNNEFWIVKNDSWIECEVIWKGYHPTLGYGDNDVWGQRIAFIREDSLFKAKYIDVHGDTTTDPSNHAISLQTGFCDPPEIDYSAHDDEFLVGWGDPRNSPDPGDWQNIQWDLYCQPLDINDEMDMLWKNDTRDGIVTDTENVPLATSNEMETSIMGIAHHPERNEFLLVFEYEDTTTQNSLDIYGMLVSGLPTSVEDDIRSLPTSSGLSQNYPNPFNPGTEIAYTLPSAQDVYLAVFDITGRHIKTLILAEQSAGPHMAIWDGTNAVGEQVASGMYLYRIETNSKNETRRMILIR